MLNGSHLIRTLFINALDRYFDSNLDRMAQQLKCTCTEIERALSVDDTRIRSKAFESLVVYCLKNQLSIDSLLSAAPESDGFHSSITSQPSKADKHSML